MHANEDNLSVSNVLTRLASDIELMDDPHSVKWRCLLSENAYEAVKEMPDLIYESNGEEFLRVLRSYDPKYAINMRIAAVFPSFDQNGNKQIIALREIDYEP